MIVYGCYLRVLCLVSDETKIKRADNFNLKIEIVTSLFATKFRFPQTIVVFVPQKLNIINKKA